MLRALPFLLSASAVISGCVQPRNEEEPQTTEEQEGDDATSRDPVLTVVPAATSGSRLTADTVVGDDISDALFYDTLLKATCRFLATTDGYRCVPYPVIMESSQHAQCRYGPAGGGFVEQCPTLGRGYLLQTDACTKLTSAIPFAEGATPDGCALLGDNALTQMVRADRVLVDIGTRYQVERYLADDGSTMVIPGTLVDKLEGTHCLFDSEVERLICRVPDALASSLFDDSECTRPVYRRPFSPTSSCDATPAPSKIVRYDDADFNAAATRYYVAKELPLRGDALYRRTNGQCELAEQLITGASDAYWATDELAQFSEYPPATKALLGDGRLQSHARTLLDGGALALPAFYDRDLQTDCIILSYDGPRCLPQRSARPSAFLYTDAQCTQRALRSADLIGATYVFDMTCRAVNGVYKAGTQLDATTPLFQIAQGTSDCVSSPSNAGDTFVALEHLPPSAFAQPQ